MRRRTGAFFVTNAETRSALQTSRGSTDNFNSQKWTAQARYRYKVTNRETHDGLFMFRIATTIFLAVFCTVAYPLAAEEVSVRFSDLQKVSGDRWIAAGVTLPVQDSALPVVAETATDSASRVLRLLHGRGIANGFQGILYDNRDRGHSDLKQDLYPRLHRVAYGPRLQSMGLDYGLARSILYPGVVFGNSSTAITGGPYARSIPRIAMTSDEAAASSAWLYSNNHIYIYPEHRDYDSVDKYPAHWPYHLVSQGSSGSDQPFLRAVAATLAALPSDTLKFMKEHGLVSPTIHMILRRNLRHVVTPSDYFSGVAHRPVLQGDDLRPGSMVAQAGSLRPENVQAMVLIKVISEDFTRRAGLAGLDEALFDTPSAIARIWRGFEGRKEIVVSAEDTKDPTGRPITFAWHLFQGDPSKVSIEPFGDRSQNARISIDWHDPFSVPVVSERALQSRESARVDIGVFASNGDGLSAPAVISITFPAHQKRTYLQRQGDTPQLSRIDYDSVSSNTYFDPVLYWFAKWSDSAIYDDTGKLLGWRRAFANNPEKDTTVPVYGPAGAYAFVNTAVQPELVYSKKVETPTTE